MRNIRTVKCYLLALIMGVALLLPSFDVKATSKGDISKAESSIRSVDFNTSITLNSSSGLSSLIKTANSKSVRSVLSCSGKTVTFKKKEYNSMSMVEKRDSMRGMLTVISASKINTADKTRLYNFVAEQDASASALVRELSEDVRADYATAMAWFKPFSGGIGTFFGLVCLLTMMFLTATIVMDLAYITVPLFRCMVTKNINERPMFISHEAFTSVLDSESGTTFKSAMTSYLKRRVGSVIALSICIAYLISGEIYTVIAYIIDAILQVVG